MMKSTTTNALATRYFPHCKWYIVMAVSFLFFSEDFCNRGRSGNTVHGVFVVISPSLWSNTMTITCVIL